jgi:hypothetical protein
MSPTAVLSASITSVISIAVAAADAAAEHVEVLAFLSPAASFVAQIKP